MNFDFLQNLFSHLNFKVRFIVSIGVASLVFLLMPSSMDWEIHVLGSWDIGILCFLLLIGVSIINTFPARTIACARLQGFNSSTVFALVILTACMSIFVIGVMLTDSKDTPQPFRAIQIWLSLIAVLCSWLLTHVMFAVHYAHIYYKSSNPAQPTLYDQGLQFPADILPDYLDFMYFSFTIGMTSQTSDITIVARPLRRLVLIHSLVSFFFYTVILATTINTVASLI